MRGDPGSAADGPLDHAARRVLLRGGSVYSPAAPFATAMLTVGREVAWVGGDKQAASYVDSADQVVDLQGRLVTPGFVDAHAHLWPTGLALRALDLSRTHSATEALAEIAAYAKSLPRLQVLVAHGWDESHWPGDAPLTGAGLDRAVGDRPAYASRIDGHSAVISSALAAHVAGLTGCDGWLADGLVTRDAHHRVRDAVAARFSPSERKDILLASLRHAASHGLTSVHELNAPHIASVDDFVTLAEICREQAVPEVVSYWGGLTGSGVDPGLLYDAGVTLHGFAGDLNVDGSIGSHTAALHDPYDDDPSTSGMRYLGPDEVREHVVHCTRRGLQAGFHVIGDAGVQTAVAGFLAAAEEVGEDQIVRARHRLEHVEMITPEQVAVLARLGVAASVQPAFDALWGGPGGLYEHRLGSARAQSMNPFGSMLAAGVVLAFGSDSPVTPLDPWAGIRAAVYHHNPTERVSVASALHAHTCGGHWARRADGRGVLAPGADASYAVWDVATNPVPAAERGAAGRPASADTYHPPLPNLEPRLPLPECVHTVGSGATVYDSGDLS